MKCAADVLSQTSGVSLGSLLRRRGVMGCFTRSSRTVGFELEATQKSVPTHKSTHKRTKPKRLHTQTETNCRRARISRSSSCPFLIRWLVVSSYSISTTLAIIKSIHTRTHFQRCCESSVLGEPSKDVRRVESQYLFDRHMSFIVRNAIDEHLSQAPTSLNR